MAIDTSDILDMLWEKLKTRSQTELAADIGIKVQYLNDVLHKRTGPGPAILTYLGIEKRETYVRVK